MKTQNSQWETLRKKLQKLVKKNQKKSKKSAVQPPGEIHAGAGWPPHVAYDKDGRVKWPQAADYGESRKLVEPNDEYRRVVEKAISRAA